MGRSVRGNIVNIKDLFLVYKDRLRAPQKTVIKVFIEVSTALLNISPKENQCNYSPTTRTINLSVSGPLKSEIQIHKKEILSHMRARLGEKNFPTEIL